MTDAELDAMFARARADLAAAAAADAAAEPIAVPHLVALHGHATPAVFAHAVALCADPAPTERVLGLRVLGELGGPSRPFAARAVPRLLPLLDDPVADVRQAAVVAICRQLPTPADAPWRAEAIAAVRARAADLVPGVRRSVAVHLPGAIGDAPRDLADVAALVALAADPVADTRWYALAGLVDDLHLADHPAVRAALHARTHDPDPQIRASAAAALATGAFGP